MIYPYIDNNYFMFYPPIPGNCSKPPTLYSILESIVNYGKDDKTKIKDLAKVGRLKIFDFDYPLSDKISKEDFECMILNHFLTRRIEFDTPTLFKIKLNVKLNEIMPIYNKMFDSLDGWDIFRDGEKTSRYGSDDREMVSETENNLHNESTSENTSDRRYSDTPQDNIDNVKNGKYLTSYNYDTNNGTDESSSSGTSNNTTTDNNRYAETIEKTSANKIEILKQMQTEIKSIYSLIFKDLDDLFYSVL